MKIYTKQGDAGLSSLFDGTRVPKNHPRLLAYGALDELNSHLGLAVTLCSHPALAIQLQHLQRLLFYLCADLATPIHPPGSAIEKKIRRITPQDALDLEHQIDAATAQLPPLKHFILPGGGITAARLHIARTVCRRAETLILAIPECALPPPGPAPSNATAPPNPLLPALILVNRLSDLLFTLARLANKLDGISDVEWIPEARENSGD